MTDIAQGWHVDKAVPLTVVLALIMQTAGAIWWGSSISARVAAIEQEQIEHARIIDSIKDVAVNRGERLAALEAGQRAILEAIKRIDAKLDRL